MKTNKIKNNDLLDADQYRTYEVERLFVPANLRHVEALENSAGNHTCFTGGST
jgi:hypothetical protein